MTISFEKTQSHFKVKKGHITIITKIDWAEREMKNQGGCLGQDIPTESCDNVLFILQKGYAILLPYFMISFVNYNFPENNKVFPIIT